MVGVVVNSQRGVTSACRCNSGECEVRLIHSVSQQLTRINGLAAAQTENHICIFHNFILFQVFYSLEGCFTGEQDIINLYNTVLCCFIQIFLCCVDRNFITDNNSLCTIGRAYLVDFLVSIFTCGIAGKNTVLFAIITFLLKNLNSQKLPHYFEQKLFIPVKQAPLCTQRKYIPLLYK